MHGFLKFGYLEFSQYPIWKHCAHASHSRVIIFSNIPHWACMSNKGHSMTDRHPVFVARDIPRTTALHGTVDIPVNTTPYPSSHMFPVLRTHVKSVSSC